MYDRFKSDAFDSEGIGHKIEADIKDGRLLGYTFHPLSDWRSTPNMVLDTIETNAYGLRSQHPPFSQEGSSRCLLIGGSFAWGFGASANTRTPAYQLEALCGRDNRPMDFVCCADQAFTSVQELKSFIFAVDELRPDYVICVTGHNDVGMAYKNIFKNHVKYKDFSRFFNWGIKTGLMRDSGFLVNLLRFLAKGFKRREDFWGENMEMLKPPPDDIPLALMRHKIDVIASYCIAKKIKVAFVLQPLLILKRQHSKMEMECLRDEPTEKATFFKEQFSIFQDSFANRFGYDHDNIAFLDTTNYFDDLPESIFFDTCHITDRGFAIWSEKLFQDLKDLKFF